MTPTPLPTRRATDRPRCVGGALAGVALGAAASTLAGCAQPSLARGETERIDGSAGTAIEATVLDAFDAPWAMSFLPDGRALVTEKSGALFLLDADGVRLGPVAGVPEVRAAGQGGLGDVLPHPDFADNALVYLSHVEREGERSGAVVVRAPLVVDAGGARLGEPERIWEQVPKLDSTRHYGHRLAFGPDGLLYVSSGDRGLQTPAQDMDVNLGKIVRLTDDGAPPADNPFADRGGVAAELWSVGHRNALGLDVAADGALWAHEMGPKGGDELNRIVAGANYGWPVVSDGVNYSGAPIPDHATNPDYAGPAISWVPSVSPSGLVMYDGELFPDWRGQALLGALSGRALLRVGVGGEGVREGDELERFEWGARVREVEQAPDGALWVLEDAPSGRLLRLAPAG